MAIESSPQFEHDKLLVRNSIQRSLIERSLPEGEDPDAYGLKWINVHSANFEKLFNEQHSTNPSFLENFYQNSESVIKEFEDRLSEMENNSDLKMAA